MSESPPPPKMEQSQIDKQGLGLLIPYTTSSDPITAVPIIMVQNGVDDSSLGENENGEEGLRLEIERGIYQLTLEQAEIEADHNRLEAIDGVEERKDLETVQNVDLDEGKNENDGFGVKGEIENDVFEAGKDVKTEDLEKNKNEINAESVEEKNQLGDEENEGFAEGKGVKMEDLGEKKIGKDVESVEEENEWGVEENEGFEEGKDVKTENIEEKKKQSVGDDENEGFAEGKVVNTENLDEKKNGKDAESVEEENQLGDEENEGFEEGNVKMEYLDENKNGKNAESVEEENGWGVEGNEGFWDGRNLKIDLDENTNEKYSESVEEENENEGADELGEGATRLGRNNQSSNRRRMNYPMRPDADDCAYYMKFGSCKFGLNCRFNHPPRRKSQGVKERVKQGEENSERAEQTECRYYRTAGGCTYGKNCKYFHPFDKSTTSHAAELNFLGLPIRLGERECPYYMRTGSCKYGPSCRFHHPDPTTVAGGDPSGYGNGRSIPPQHVSSSSVSSWSSPRALNDTSPFMSPIFTPTQGVITTPSPAWNGYQASTYQTSERGLPTPPAFAVLNNHLSNFPMQPRQLYDLPVEEYPERPGEPECSFFLKTGDCKYKSSCKFHHPKNCFSKTKANTYSLSDKGLPLRPDHPICAHYHQYGICKYGPSCKYDHPSGLNILPPRPVDQQKFGNSNILYGADKTRKGNASGFSNSD